MFKARSHHPFPAFGLHRLWRGSAGLGETRARRRCESQPAGGPGPAAWLLLLQEGNLTPASQALRCEWAGKEPFLRLFAPQVPATWLAWWDRRPGRYHAELPRSASAPAPRPSPCPAFREASGGAARARPSPVSFCRAERRPRLLSFRALRARATFPPWGQAATSKPPRRSAPCRVLAQPGASAEVGLGARGGGAGGR